MGARPPDEEPDDAALRRGPHVFVDDLDAPRLRPEDDHHLRRALRRRDGEVLTASDGTGRWRVLRLGDPPEPVGPVQRREVPGPRLTVGVAVAKGDRPELVVQKLTELGIDRIVLLRTERGVVRWDDDRAAKHLERLRRVAREAAMQSRRCALPEVLGPLDLAALVGEGEGVGVAAPAGPELDAATTTVLVGPEGGWSHAERGALGRPVGLGATILRTETAAVVAGALLVDRHRGWRGWAATTPS